MYYIASKNHNGLKSVEYYHASHNLLPSKLFRSMIIHFVTEDLLIMSRALTNAQKTTQRNRARDRYVSEMASHLVDTTLSAEKQSG